MGVADARAAVADSHNGARPIADSHNGAHPIAEPVSNHTLQLREHRAEGTLIRRRGWLVRRMLLGADLLGLCVAFGLVQLLTGEPTADHIAPGTEFFILVGSLPVWILLAKLHGLYDRDEERTDHTTVDDIAGVFRLVTIAVWVVLVVTWLTDIANPSPTKLMLSWAFAFGSITFFRALARSLCRRQLAYIQNTIIVGAGEVGQLVARKLLQHPEYGINLVGFVDAEPKERRDDLDHLTIVGTCDDLPQLIELLDVERVIIAFSNDSHERTLSLIRSLKDADVQVDIVPRFFEILGVGVGVHTVEGVPLLGMPIPRLSRSARLLKRGLDLGLTAVGLTLLAPVLALVALAIKLDSPGPVFFRQVRMGCGDRTFRIFKFRTMVADADARKDEVAHLNMNLHNGGDPRMFKIPRDPRATRVGRFLRKTSLDELPQLINVLRGEMSLVGPRPLILEEDQHVREWARDRLNLKPGVTGLWQVLGRNHIPFEEMTKLDYLYVTNWSLWQDVRLILQTIPVLARTGRSY
ncbi:MAG: sugar transferase [Gaiellaceae bacterium]